MQNGSWIPSEIRKCINENFGLESDLDNYNCNITHNGLKVCGVRTELLAELMQTFECCDKEIGYRHQIYCQTVDHYLSCSSNACRDTRKFLPFLCLNPLSSPLIPNVFVAFGIPQSGIIWNLSCNFIPCWPYRLHEIWSAEEFQLWAPVFSTVTGEELSKLKHPFLWNRELSLLDQLDSLGSILQDDKIAEDASLLAAQSITVAVDGNIPVHIGYSFLSLFGRIPEHHLWIKRKQLQQLLDLSQTDLLEFILPVIPAMIATTQGSQTLLNAIPRLVGLSLAGSLQSPPMSPRLTTIRDVNFTMLCGLNADSILHYFVLFASSNRHQAPLDEWMSRFHLVCDQFVGEALGLDEVRKADLFRRLSYSVSMDLQSLVSEQEALSYCLNCILLVCLLEPNAEASMDTLVILLDRVYIFQANDRNHLESLNWLRMQLRTPPVLHLLLCPFGDDTLSECKPSCRLMRNIRDYCLGKTGVGFEDFLNFIISLSLDPLGNHVEKILLGLLLKHVQRELRGVLKNDVVFETLKRFVVEKCKSPCPTVASTANRICDLLFISTAKMISQSSRNSEYAPLTSISLTSAKMASWELSNLLTLNDRFSPSMIYGLKRLSTLIRRGEDLSLAGRFDCERIMAKVETSESFSFELCAFEEELNDAAPLSPFLCELRSSISSTHFHLPFDVATALSRVDFAVLGYLQWLLGQCFAIMHGFLMSVLDNVPRMTMTSVDYEVFFNSGLLISYCSVL